MAKSKKIYVAQHTSSIQINEFIDRMLGGLEDLDEIKKDVDQIRANLKVPQMIYFDSMSTAARFFNLPVSTVKSAVHRGTSMRNGYKVSKVDVIYNLDEKRGLHLNPKDQD